MSVQPAPFRVLMAVWCACFFLAVPGVRAESLYLELEEIHTDTFDSLLLLPGTHSFTPPFTFNGHTLGIRPVIMTLNESSLQENNIPLASDLSPEDLEALHAGEDSGIFVLQVIRYDGMGRDSRYERYHAAASLPLILKGPVPAASGSSSLHMETPEGDIVPVEPPPLKDGDLFNLAFSDAYEPLLSIRLWPGDLELLEVDEEGAVNVRLADLFVRIPPGESSVLAKTGMTLAVSEKDYTGEKVSLGDITFTTVLTLANHGFVEVVPVTPGTEDEEADR